MNISKEYIGSAVIVIAGVLGLFGKTVDTVSLTSFISSAVIVVSGIVVMISRFKKGDINILGGKVN